MNICLSNDEKYFLQKFADEQHDGAKANVGTVTPIHLVMRKRKHFCESSYGDIFVILGIGGRAIEPLSFTEIEDGINRLNNYMDLNLPKYEDVMYEVINGITIRNEDDYFEAFNIAFCKGEDFEYEEPVAFFLIRSEAERYMNDYQKHNCHDCFIYTYGLGYHNQGEMPVFRNLLMRIGKSLNNNQEDYI